MDSNRLLFAIDINRIMGAGQMDISFFVEYFESDVAIATTKYEFDWILW